MSDISNCLECPFWKFIDYGLNNVELYDCCVEPFQELDAANICVFLNNRFLDANKKD